jgi:hypothetical protein
MVLLQLNSTPSANGHFLAPPQLSRTTLFHFSSTKDIMHYKLNCIMWLKWYAPHSIYQTFTEPKCANLQMWWDWSNVWKKLVVSDDEVISSFSFHIHGEMFLAMICNSTMAYALAGKVVRFTCHSTSLLPFCVSLDRDFPDSHIGRKLSMASPTTSYIWKGGVGICVCV